MLNIICGEAGTGKSTELYSRIKEDAQKGRRVFLFVPDQFSFEAEKIIYKSVPPPASVNVSVTMFSRAAQKLLHLYGETKAYADDVVKTMLMTRVLNTLAAQGRLVYYRRQLKKSGFPAFALSIVSQLRSSGLTPSGLRSAVGENEDFGELLMNKLNDICEIYSEYDGLLTRSFDDRLDDVRRAAELAAQADYFENACCYFDGFDDFSGSQLVFIGSLMQRAENVTFAITSDSPDSVKSHFRGTSRIISKLREMADGEAEITVMKKHFRDSKGQIIKAKDPWQESDWICARIRGLMDEGYRCRDIAVLTANPVYSRILGSAMKKYEIPFFADIPESLLSKSAVRFSLDALRALSFETDDLLRYIKSGFVRHGDGKTISRVQIDRLERLSRKYDLRKRDWLRAFPEKLDESGELEELRRSVVEPLKRLKKRIDGADGAEMTAALCDFICNEMDINRSLYGLCLGDTRDENGKIVVNKKKMEEYSAVWDDTVTIFESAHEALKGYYPSLSEYIDILTGIFAAAQIAKPPQVLDAVTIGDVERSRLRRVRAVFICGFNQGVMPRPTRASGAFTGGETEQLAQCGIAIGGDRESRYASEMFLLYRCTNIPEERLFVTFPMLSESFSELSPSPYIENIKRNFGAEILGADEFGADFYCRTVQSARRFLAGIYSDPSRRAERESIIAALGKDISLYEDGDGGRRIISPEQARALLSLKTYSPTALNSINNCKFGFFCAYGLGLREDDERAVNPMLSGSVVHYCLERLLKEYGDKPQELSGLSDADILNHTRGSVENYKKEVFFGDFGAAERFSYQLSGLSEIAAAAAIRVRDSMRFSNFRPLALEREISFKFGDITIKGICDRLDVSETEGGKFLRVVDYKRGKKELPLESVYSGENLQMLLYLFGLCEQENAQPSAVLYQPIGADELTADSGTDREQSGTEQKRTNERLHAAGGLALRDSPDERELSEINDRYTELYGKTRGGYCTPKYISKSGFDGLREYCKAYVNAQVLQTLGGMASACPKKAESCAYCPYSLFCGGRADSP